MTATDELPLNSDQALAVDRLKEFYTSPGQYFYALTGFAGVGKSFTIQRFIKWVRMSHPAAMISVTAPTHKAVKVLIEMAKDYALDGVFTNTIYSALGLVLDSSGEEKRTKRLARGNFEDMDLVVIDEGSMLPRWMWVIIKERAQQFRVKVVVMGDIFQLPPVKEVESPALTDVDLVSHLTQPMRQEVGNPILELVSDLRSDIANGTSKTQFRSRYNAKLDCGIYVMSPAEWIQSIKDNFTAEEYHDNPDMFRCVAWTNKRVNTLNRMIRKLLVGETVSPFIVGERVLTRQPILEPGPDGRPEVIANTDEECEVLDTYEGWHPDYEGMTTPFKVWVTLLRSPRNAVTEVYLLHDDSASDHKKTMNSLAESAKKNPSLWKNFWGFKDSFADLQPPHALTAHRAQGSSYDNVFVDVRDIMQNLRQKERNQLLYVACSRARENLLVMK